MKGRPFEVTNITKISETTLKERYLLRNGEGEIVETIDDLWRRVAYCIASVEPTETLQQYWGEKFYDILVNLDFLPNTPTLMNAGLKNGMLSACFVLPVEDSIPGIFNTLRDAALIQQQGGGTGFSGARLRPEGTRVDNKQGVASGPNSFFTVYNQTTEIMKQGGRRKGANMMVQRIDHPDILAFIDMKLTPGVMTNFNVSVAVTDAFMEAVENDDLYDLYHPSTGVTGRLRARDVWKKIAQNAHSSAEPGILFIDRANQKSAYWEEIEATNPCGEQFLPPYGSCNLGSINLSNFVEDGKIDWIRLDKVTAVATRFLDNVIDANHYPTQELEDHALRYRNIGLGVMGWADMLIRLKQGYGSADSLELARNLQWFVNESAHKTSTELAVEKGMPSGAPFKNFFSYSSPKRRNATLTTVAPTGTISMIAGCSSGIEPVFAFEMERHQMGMVLKDYHPLYQAALNNGGVREDVFVASHQVSVESHVDMQAAFQENCDSSISKTINMPSDVTVDDVVEAYNRAWVTGCKGITVYVDGSREGVLHKLETQDDDSFEPECHCEDVTEVSIIKQDGCETCTSCGWSKCLIA